MKKPVFIITAIACLSPALCHSETDLQTVVADAIESLRRQPSYSWSTMTETASPFGGGDAVNGQYESSGYAYISLPAAGNRLGFVAKDGQFAVQIDENWQTLEHASAQSGGERRGSFGPRAIATLIRNYKLPAAQADELLTKTADLRQEGNAITGRLDSAVARAILSSAGPGGGRRGRTGSALNDVGGEVTFWTDKGMLTRFSISLTGSFRFRDNTIPLDRTITTTLTDIGTTKVEVPLDAKEIVDALLNGKTPDVFVPEPGFKKLFNGRDLTGWSGRPGFWSVEDRAIVGRTTADHPAPGNTFLIAKQGDENLIVEDFELRFSYRIKANNPAGFANSGVQYRSQDRGDFVVAGYQADLEAGTQYSGILYDEAGGAGGRSIMAMRGEKVSWTREGKREVTGPLGSPEDIQHAIKKDDWNDYVIIAEGRRLRHFINGMQTIDVIDDTDSKRLASGILALQLHAGQPMTVEFKNIRIKSLSSAAASGASNVTVTNDFRLDLLYTVPKASEGSWVALCADPKGRLIVSDQNGGLYRLALPPATQHGAIEPERIDLDIGGAHGLLCAFDSLYVMVNERGARGLYRVRDTDGDDRFDEVKLLRRLEASGEHGAHSLVLSPDGQSIYVVVGNQSRLTSIDSSRVPLNWSEDNLIPRIPTGFMDDSLAPQGWIARTDPAGEKWELIAAGFRNHFDVAFNRDGELFTYDADMEWDIGMPFYRPTRVNHVISGAEFGFRNGSGKWPDYFIDSFGAAVDIGPGSPTGICFGYGAKFPAKYQDALFICDWSFGKLRAVHLRPSGASYVAEVEDFISGQPLPLTDVIINPVDGAMYFIVGGRDTQSALYRVTYAGNESTAPSQTKDPLGERRLIRQRLERFHGWQDAAAVDEAWAYLADQDRAIRYAARIALEWQDPERWRERALGESDPRKAIASLVALARVSGRDELHRRDDDLAPDPVLRSKMLEALDRIDWSSLTEADRLDLLRAYGLVFIRLGKPDDAARQRLAATFEPRLPAETTRLNVQLANLLVYLQAPGAATRIMDLFRQATSQEEQIDYALALRALETGWTLPLREEYFRWFVTTAAAYRGGNTFASSLRTIKNEAMESLTDDERARLASVLEAAPEQKSPQDQLAARPFVTEWTVDKLLPLVESGLQRPRDFDRGRRAYGEVACAACHRFAQEGGSVGPDLSGVAGRFSVRDLLESIVEPSKVISDQYGAIIITKTSGQIVTGRVGNLSGDTLHVIENMLEPGRTTNVRRQEIESIEPSRVSMMPQGLLNSLTEEEVLDLMAYLLSRGDRNLAMFKR
jgi:putative heme-binding domain-containing protein